MKRNQQPINWTAVEASMLKSFRGQPRTEEEIRISDEAYRRAPKKYCEVNDSVRYAEVQAIRRSGGAR